MRHFIFEKNMPSLGYITNHWPNTKHLLKKFIFQIIKNQIFITYKLS